MNDKYVSRSVTQCVIEDENADTLESSMELGRIFYIDTEDRLLIGRACVTNKEVDC